ncbi:MAG TPA: sigma-70 family RNA polymerase sigma factor [Gaiellaceae bacterium]
MSEQVPDTEGRGLAEDARDRVRFEEEALSFADQAYQVARHLAGSKEEAEELMQDAYARAFRSWRSYTPGTNMRAWLLRILTNINIDKGRQKQRRPPERSLEEGDYSLYDRLEETAGADSADDEERLLHRLSQSSIVDALAELPHDFRDVLVLVDLGEFSYQETAQILSVPIGTVMSRLHRARRLLRQSLASSLGEKQ